MTGLRALQQAGKPITVISVAHRDNYSKLLELTELLTVNGLANQHHMCAPSYSGEAKENYAELSLLEPRFCELQQIIDQQYGEFERQGMHVTFNSYWPATGLRGKRRNVEQYNFIPLSDIDIT